MTRPHPLTAMREREWSEAWEEQQRIVDEQLKSQRGSWLPNVIERRRWGALRWTSGRPGHAATSGRAVTERFVVVRPDTDAELHDRVVEALRDPAPVFRIMGFGLQRHDVIGLVSGALAVGLLGGAGAAIAGLGVVALVIGVVVGAAIGGAAGTAGARYTVDRQRSAVLEDEDQLRTVVGRYTSKSWIRLVEAASALEAVLPPNAGKSLEDPDAQTVEAIHIAIWEAAGLLVSSSDHTGVEVLAENMERLERAHRRGIGR